MATTTTPTAATTTATPNQDAEGGVIRRKETIEPSCSYSSGFASAALALKAVVLASSSPTTTTTTTRVHAVNADSLQRRRERNKISAKKTRDMRRLELTLLRESVAEATRTIQQLVDVNRALNNQLSILMGDELVVDPVSDPSSRVPCPPPHSLYFLTTIVRRGRLRQVAAPRAAARDSGCARAAYC